MSLQEDAWGTLILFKGCDAHKKWCAWINHVFIVNTAIFHKKQELISSDFMVKVSELQTVVFIF